MPATGLQLNNTANSVDDIMSCKHIGIELAASRPVVFVYCPCPLDTVVPAILPARLRVRVTVPHVSLVYDLRRRCAGRLLIAQSGLSFEELAGEVLARQPPSGDHESRESQGPSLC